MSINKAKKKFYNFLCGNKYAQHYLDKRVRRLLGLMGVGSGGRVESSGELVILKKLKAMKRENYCVFDVGANKGDFTKLLVSGFENGERFEVHSFEPSKATFDMLRSRVEGEENVVLNNIGLGKEKGEFDFFTDFPGSGTASLTKRQLDYLGVDFHFSERVAIDTVDNYCTDNAIEHIDLLKIDVEGHELDVLRGGEGMFGADGIGMVSFEFGGCNIDTRTFFKDFYYFLKDYKFRVYRITPSEYLHPIVSYKEIYEQFRTTNFLAVHENCCGV